MVPQNLSAWISDAVPPLDLPPVGSPQEILSRSLGGEDHLHRLSPQCSSCQTKENQNRSSDAEVEQRCGRSSQGEDDVPTCSTRLTSRGMSRRSWSGMAVGVVCLAGFVMN